MVDEFDRLLQAAAEWKQPPVSRWKPPLTRDMDLVIGRDGEWRYRGTPFARRDIARLLSGLLVRDDDGYCLVSPDERLRIRVEDVPFTVTDFEYRGDGPERQVVMKTSLDHSFPLDGEHPLRSPDAEQDRCSGPLVTVRDNLEARMTRSAYYRLVDLGEERDTGGRREFGVYSFGEFFSLGRVTW